MGVMLNLNDCSSAIHILRDNPYSILFVTSQLRPRELKMAHGLRQHGWSVGLIYYKWTPFDPASFFDFSIEVGSPHEAHAVAKQLSPRITHVFSGAIDDFVMLFCRDKPSPVVIDLNDVFAPSLFDYCHERFEPTREALELADGFCARDLQVKSAERRDGFKLPKHVILFPEYCWQPAPQGIASMPADEVHIVSVGTFSLETQGMYDSCYLQMAKLLIEQEIHFHIYPHWAYRRDHAGSPHANFERDFADFLALERTTPYLHLHDSLPLDELAKVLPQYDFGIVSGGCAELGQKLGFYYPAYLETCYSGRISDYLEARLPVLVNDEVKFDYWLLKRYGVCVDLKGVLQPDYKKKLVEIKNDQQRRIAMERAVNELSVTKNVRRLAKFYTQVLGIPEQENISLTAVPVFAMPTKTAAVEVKHEAVSASPLPDSVPKSVAPSVVKRIASALRDGIRWLSPRAAKVILPYRAIRIFEVRLHNALINLEENRLHIANQQRQIDEWRVSHAALREQFENAERDVVSIGAKLQQCEFALVEQRQSLIVANEELEALRGREAELLQKLEDASSNEEQLHAELEQREFTLDESRQSLTSANEELGVLRGREAELLQKLEDASSNEEQLLAELEQRQLALEESRQRLIFASEELEVLRNREIELGQKLEDSSRNEESLSAQLRQHNLTLENLEKIRSELLCEVEELRRRMHLLEVEREELLVAVGEKAVLENKKMELGAKIETLELLHRQDEAWVVSLQQDKAQFLDLIKSTEHAHEATRAELVRVAAANEMLERQSSKLHEQLLKLSDEKSIAQAQSLELERDQRLIKAQLAEQSKFVEELRGHASELEQVNSALKKAVESPGMEQLKVAARHMSSRIVDAVHATDDNFVIDSVPKLLIACMPKSGSTWLNLILEKNLGLSSQRCYLEADRNEQEIDPVALFEAWGKRTLFVQQHIRYSRVSMKLFSAFSTKIVVLTRRLEDIVISLRDHIEHESPEWSMFFMEADWFREMSADQRIDFIIDHAMPWYVNFYLGWRHAAKLYPQSILQVSYEDLVTDSVACVNRIASFYGVSLEEVFASDLDLRAGTRFNQGKIGRGKAELSPAQQERLRQLVSHYRHGDFAPIGF